MTLIEAINRIDSLKPNGFLQEDKVRWLSNLEGSIKSEIIDKHEGAENVTFNGYNESTNLNTVLLVPAPYDDVYVRYLEMQMDYTNGEYARFENSVTMYNNAYSAFERHYNRTHMPLGKNFKFF